jgi:hypothetical protein
MEADILDTVAIACRTIHDEIMQAVQSVKSEYPIIWVESGLHNSPGKLNRHLQTEIEKLDNVNNILLVFGYCGNALLDLVSSKGKLIFPKVDDCISLLLGGNTKKNLLNKEAAAYYLTRGWLSYENNIWDEYTHCVNRFGYDKAQSIFKTILNNYVNLNIIDTGAYDLTEFLEQTDKIATELGLKHQVVPGTLDLLQKAFSGRWDEGFAVIEPGKVIDYNDLGFI